MLQPMSRRLYTVALLTALAMPLSATPARACTTCVTGDPTLTAMGAQQPFEGRLRLSLEASHRSERFGLPGDNETTVDEQRLTASVAYAPSTHLMLSLQVPVVRRHVQYVSLATETLVNLGDIEARARLILFTDTQFAPDHVLAVVGGVKFPTAPLHEEDGEYAEPEVQSGNGSFDPLIGVSYSFFADPLSIYVSEVVYIPTPSRADWRVGTSWLGTHTIQYQLIDTLAIRLGANTRLDETMSRDFGDEPDSGGFILYAAPSLLYSPTMDLVLHAEVSVPVAHAQRGDHEEGLVAVLGVAYDL